MWREKPVENTPALMLVAIDRTSYWMTAVHLSGVTGAAITPTHRPLTVKVLVIAGSTIVTAMKLSSASAAEAVPSIVILFQGGATCVFEAVVFHVAVILGGEALRAVTVERAMRLGTAGAPAAAKITVTASTPSPGHTEASLQTQHPAKAPPHVESSLQYMSTCIYQTQRLLSQINILNRHPYLCQLEDLLLQHAVQIHDGSHTPKTQPICPGLPPQQLPHQWLQVTKTLFSYGNVSKKMLRSCTSRRSAVDLCLIEEMIPSSQSVSVWNRKET
jgi:hypothetical protein